MLSQEEKITLLRSVEMFAEASGAILEKLGEIAEEVAFPKGEELITQGKRCPNLYVSISGEIGIYIREGEVSREIAQLGESGKVVGEIGTVSGLNATATVRTISEEARFLKLEGEAFHRIVSVEPELATTVLRSLARYLQGK